MSGKTVRISGKNYDISGKKFCIFGLIMILPENVLYVQKNFCISGKKFRQHFFGENIN